MNGLRLYGRYVASALRVQMHHPGSLLIQGFAQFCATGVEFVGLWALFARFHRIAGWQFPEVALFYGAVNIMFALADIPTRAFDVFGTEFVRTGDFDRLLLRPRATWLQLLGAELRLNRFGRLLQGLAVLSFAIALLPIEWDPLAVALLMAAVAGGVALFLGIFLLQATLAFWTIESLEIANTVTYGGVEAAQYPLGIYAGWFRRFLTFVVPLGCVAYFPIAAVLGRNDALGIPAWLPYVSPAAGFLFLGLALWAWRFGVRHYCSTGS